VFYPAIPVTQFSTVLTNVIYELTAVVTSERISVYANGQLINNGQQNAVVPAAGFAVNTMLFGALRGSDGSAPTGNLGCTLYNMRVYNTALTQAQVRANFIQYRGNYGI
jgi:K+-transporting ATPase c subunit